MNLQENPLKMRRMWSFAQKQKCQFTRYYVTRIHMFKKHMHSKLLFRKIYLWTHQNWIKLSKYNYRNNSYIGSPLLRPSSFTLYFILNLLLSTILNRSILFMISPSKTSFKTKISKKVFNKMQIFAIGGTMRQSSKKDLTKNKALNPFSAFDTVENFSTLQLLNLRLKIVFFINFVVYPAMRVWLQQSFHTWIKISAASPSA